MTSVSKTRKFLFILAAALFVAASSTGPAAAAVKYVFFFIGDGMGYAQRNAAELYLAGMRAEMGDRTERSGQLLMNSLPDNGSLKTNSLSGVTDSAAAGTALATGRKTHNDAVGMNPKSGEKYTSIAKIAKSRGMKVGIVTTAFLQDATPAAFYGHAPKRTHHYDLGRQLIESDFDYFGGGGFRRPNGADGRSRSLLELAAASGYRVSTTVEGFNSLTPGPKTIAIHPKLSAGSMPWAIDSDPTGLTLARFVQKGIELLDGDGGFFMMVEGGKVDLAGHANDLATVIHEVIALDKALEAAFEFYRRRPGETLILITADHETGGMNFDAKPENAVSFYKALSRQKGSYALFEGRVSPQKNADINDYLKRASDYFGYNYSVNEAIGHAFRMSMTEKKSRPTKDKDYKKLYGPYDPLTMACIREMNRALGVTWTSFYHSGRDVPVSGVGGANFSGTFENTTLFNIIISAIE